MTLVHRDGTAISGGATLAATATGTATTAVDLSTTLGSKMKIGGLALHGVAVYSYASEPTDLDSALLWMQTMLGKYRTPYPTATVW